MSVVAGPAGPGRPAAPKTARLFLALWPDPGVRRRLHHLHVGWRWPPGAARVAANRLHLTLHFIGAVPRDRVAALAAALSRPVELFTLALGQMSVWPGGVAVLEPRTASEVPRPLLQLREALAEAMRAQALPVETRAFRPHVTLARRAAGALPPPGATTIEWAVNGYVLVESVPGPGGGYQVLQRYPPAHR